MKRILKVYSRYRGHDQFRAHYGPQIRLQGDWLEQAGVRPGDQITVEISQNQIIITKLEEDRTRVERCADRP